LNRFFDIKQGVCLAVNIFEIFRRNDIQIHASNVVNIGSWQ
jgi:hypothetical protein